MVDQPGVVTPEAVPLDLDVAGVGSRFVALVVDLCVQFATIGLISWAAALAGLGASGLPEGLVAAMAFLLVFFALLGYPVALETLWRGRTLGKAAMGLRVVTVEGAPVGFRHAAIRAAVGLVDFYLPPNGLPALVSALVTRRSQRLGDLAAGTLVLRERSALPTAHAMTFAPPRQAAGYTETLDVTGVTARDYAALRTFLSRSSALAAPARADVAARLATALAARVRPAPPADLPPEDFLRSVAARVQQRDAGT